MNKEKIDTITFRTFIWLVGAAVSFVIKPILYYFWLFIEMTISTLMILIDENPSDLFGNIWNPVVQPIHCWYGWLIITGLIYLHEIYNILRKPTDPNKLDISGWEDVTPQDKYDKNAASNLSALYGVSVSDYLNYKQTHKKPEEIFDVVQYSKFKQFFHQRKDKLWDKVKTHQLTENSAFDALKQSTRKWMIKRGFSYNDIESVCNNLYNI